MMNEILTAVQRLTVQVDRGVDILQRIADSLEVLTYYAAQEHDALDYEQGPTSLSDP